MAKFEDLTGLKIGYIVVKKRVENFEGKSDSRSQYLVSCMKCNGDHKVVGRDLKRYRTRFKQGCYLCSTFSPNPKVRFKYGRNKNGFVDKSIKIPIE